MDEIIFYYEGNQTKIKYNKTQKMKDICIKFSKQKNIDINSLIFLYGLNELNPDKTFNELLENNKINIFVYKDENKICSKCGRIINNKLINEIKALNNNINQSFITIKNQIDEFNDKNNNIYDVNQLNIIHSSIDNINKNKKEMNDLLNILIINDIQNTITSKLNDNIKQDKINLSANEIICTYNKNQEEISLLHDYSISLNKLSTKDGKLYTEGKKNINENNVEIYINNKKIKFNYSYKSKEIGEIKVKFKFKELLTSTHDMFTYCYNLKTIDFSSFNSSKIIDMAFMFFSCSSLESVKFASFNTSNVNNMNGVFYNCSSLKTINLTSFNTSKVCNMNSMFRGCSTLEEINLSMFDTNKVTDINFMFSNCLSLKEINISNFKTSKVEKIQGFFLDCKSLKKNKVKYNKSDIKISEELKIIKK